MCDWLEVLCFGEEREGGLEGGRPGGREEGRKSSSRPFRNLKTPYGAVQGVECSLSIGS